MQLAIEFPKRREPASRMHGGRRAGAGRKPANGIKAGMPHVARPRLSRHHPVHVTVRVERDVPELRRRKAYQCASWALIRMAPRQDFRVVHISIQRTHMHLLVEAENEDALSRGVRAFEISFARRINRASHRQGRVFRDRYHAAQIKTPRQARNAFAYILNNWRKHREDKLHARKLDPFSSAIAFDGWRGHTHLAGFRPPRGYEALPVKYAKRWLLKEGWRRYGLIDPRARPGPRDAA